MKNLNVYLSFDCTLAKIYFEFIYSFKVPWINVILLISYSFYQSCIIFCLVQRILIMNTLARQSRQKLYMCILILKECAKLLC